MKKEPVQYVEARPWLGILMDVQMLGIFLFVCAGAVTLLPGFSNVPKVLLIIMSTFALVITLVTVFGSPLARMMCHATLRTWFGKAVFSRETTLSYGIYFSLVMLARYSPGWTLYLWSRANEGGPRDFVPGLIILGLAVIFLLMCFTFAALSIFAAVQEGRGQATWDQGDLESSHHVWTTVVAGLLAVAAFRDLFSEGERGSIAIYVLALVTSISACRDVLAFALTFSMSKIAHGPDLVSFVQSRKKQLRPSSLTYAATLVTMTALFVFGIWRWDTLTAFSLGVIATKVLIWLWPKGYAPTSNAPSPAIT